MKKLMLVLLIFALALGAYAASEQDIKDNPNLIAQNPDALSQNPNLWNDPKVMDAFFTRASDADMEKQIAKNMDLATEYFSVPGNLKGTQGGMFLSKASNVPGVTVGISGMSAGQVSYDKNTNTISNLANAETRNLGKFDLGTLSKGDKLEALPDGTFKVTRAGAATTYDVQGATLSFNADGQPLFVMNDGTPFQVKNSEGLKQIQVKQDGNDVVMSTFGRDANGKIISRGNVLLDNGMRLQGSASFRVEGGVISRIKVFDNTEAKNEDMESYVQVQDTFFKAIDKDLVVYLTKQSYDRDSAEAGQYANTVFYNTQAPAGQIAISNLHVIGGVKINMPGCDFKQTSLTYASSRSCLGSTQTRATITAKDGVLTFQKAQQVMATNNEGTMTSWKYSEPAYYDIKTGQKIEYGVQAVEMAREAIGTRYKWGGTNLKTGTDCSGLSYTIYNSLGIKMARSASEQSGQGKVIMNGMVGDRDFSKLVPGDLLYFNTGGSCTDPKTARARFGNKAWISHMGIYAGEDASGRPTFIHAWSGGVQVGYLDEKYYSGHFVGATRPPAPASVASSTT